MQQIKENVALRKKDFSKQCFYESLVSLCEEYDYNDISIKQICKKAGFNRSTFYRCYKTKDDVIREKIIDVLNEFNQSLMNNLCGGKDNFMLLFDFLRSQGELYCILHKAHLDDLLKKVCYDNFINEFHLAEYEKVFVNNGMLAVIFAWYENGMKESNEYMTNLLSRYISIDTFLNAR